MRVSFRESDPGYNAKAVGTEIYLDGEKIEQCFTADEELGIAYCYELNEEGLVMIDPKTGDRLKEIERRGNVKIVVPLGFFET